MAFKDGSTGGGILDGFEGGSAISDKERHHSVVGAMGQKIKVSLESCRI